jgi:hypothetical protein
VDRFVLARLEGEGLAPSPEADRYALARRVSLDLIGLPPTPEETDAFVNDPRPDAYERLVDRLLATPQYGERWARRWLDLARYADTNGYEKDRNRSIWPWRDWVIRALNADQPFDQFTIEQLAGDLLPNPTRDQLVATGFHRNTMLNEEGGIDPLEYRFHAMTDRVATTGVTWLGLTVGCAQCHTHKFDPITHREYFQMMAFLNNADELELDLPEAGAAERQKANAEKAAKLIANLPQKWPGAADARQQTIDDRFAEWLQRERDRTVQWIPLTPDELKANLAFLKVQPDASVFASGDMTKSDTYDLTFRSVPSGVTAIRLEALPDERLPRHGPGRVFYEGPAGDFFLSEITAFRGGEKVVLTQPTHSFAAAKFPSEKALDGDAQSGWSIDGGQGRKHEAVFKLATPLAEAGMLSVKLLFERYYAPALGRFRISVTTDPRSAEARDLSDDLTALLARTDAELTAEQRAQLLEQFLLDAPELAAEVKTIRELTKPSKHTTTLIFQERPAESPRATTMYRRGEFLQPADRVEPAVLTVLNPLPANAPPNRLSFARWLVSPEHPLTARVTVNRQWAALFGRGLVKTTEDFGFQGEMPSHPELLDWLAREFVAQGWSMKKLHRLLVTSATYRQSSRVTPELLARDGENVLLARGPRGRLEAEMIRDSALRAAGLLSPKMGGPGVYPPQPPGVSEVAYGSPKWNASTGEDRYRRAIYTFAKRTAPYAMFTSFDAPTGEACLARRDVSNSPLQALTMLNDIVFIEAAQALGTELAKKQGSVESRIDELFRRCLTRPPADDEYAELERFLATQKHRFEASELDAKAVAGPGEGDLNERAAWTVLARAVLNLDEAITRP